MTISELAAALRTRRAGAAENGDPTLTMRDEQLVRFHTRCGRCGKALFMDDSLIVEQSTSAEKFLERCAKRLFEHHCSSGSIPQI
jgi:hypothetical protein